jgi:hypothetical protein
MKNILILILSVIVFSKSFAQTDKNGNPIFNSISTNEQAIEDILIISNYYTLKNNIENPHSSVFISTNPTLNEIENAAIDLPSDFFILTKKQKIVVMIMLQNDPKREFMTIEISTGKQSNFPAELRGDITENRANELIKGNYDPNAKILNGKLFFNNKEFTIIPNQEIKATVLNLIKKNKLDKKKPSNVYLPSKAELKSYIVFETKEGGELDFFTEIKGSEYDGVQIRPGVFTTKQSIAFYKWGRACFEIGVNTIEDAYEIFSEFIGKQVNERDKEYIRMGFYKEWEK